MFNPFYSIPSRFQDPPGVNPPDNRFRRSPFRAQLFGYHHYVMLPISASFGRNTKLCIVHVLKMDTNELTHKELKSGIAYLERLLIHLHRISDWAEEPPSIFQTRWCIQRSSAQVALRSLGFQLHQFKDYERLVQRLVQKKKSFYLALLRFHNPNALDLGDSSRSDECDTE